MSLDLNINLSPHTITEIDELIDSDPACKPLVEQRKKVGAAPGTIGTSVGAILALVLPFCGAWGTSFLALLPIIKDALNAAGPGAPVAAVVAKMHEATCR
jgi:hypothetical protein